LIIRILIADDFTLWRRSVSSIIAKQVDWHIVGEASDGAEAVRKTEELKPDLILLDIGLPKLNGIEAARQIRELAPESKILFLSQSRDPAIAEGALRTGGNGYLVKVDADSELVSAIEAVFRGKGFVSSTLRGLISGDS
jgi:DNA-binding NarL/FixJ family response regulator